MSLKSVADIQRITKEKTKMGENANVYLLKLLLFIKLWTIISESYMYRLQTHLKTANHAIKMCSFWVGRLEAKSKCTDMTSTSDRSRTTEDGGFA